MRQNPSHAGLGRKRTLQAVPSDGERGLPLFDVEEYDYSWDRLIAAPRTVEPLQQIAREYKKSELLAGAGLTPKRRVLFYGPPGCGKTLAAKVLASNLDRPLITVRFDAIVSSFLGATAANLRRVFDYIEQDQWVVLFDEFDAIGKERDNQFEHGELKRVVNSLLQMMDAYRGESLLIAATNHEKLLDSALWRRFESLVQFPPPTQQDRLLMLRQFLRGVDASELNFDQIARQLKGATGADIERAAIEAARRALVDGSRRIRRKDIDVAIADHRERLRVIGMENNSKGPTIRLNSPSPAESEIDAG